MDISRVSFISIESAVRGGSIALFTNREITASRVGDGEVSRSEDLLPNIAEMLEEASVRPDQLELIVVSRGPGSFTGIRIGIATAMGLGDALGVSVVGVPLFEMIRRSSPQLSKGVIVVPIGRQDLAWQAFDDGSHLPYPHNAGPRAGTVDDFLKSIGDSVEVEICCHSSIYEALAARLNESDQLKSIGPNLAEIIGNSILQSGEPASSLEPIYVSNSAVRAQ